MWLFKNSYYPFQIAFNNYSAEECKNSWLRVQKRIRKYRLLSEVLHDAKEWITKPWTDFYRGSKSVIITFFPHFN